MNNKCTGLFGWLFGHKFKARIAVERYPIRQKFESKGFGDMIGELRAIAGEKETYCGDVCERCGLVVNHPTAHQEGLKL